MNDSLFRDNSRPFVRRVRIVNYKSIGKCDVELTALTILVGRNGAGKSNFLDALSFVTDGITTSLDHAIRQRGGIDAVRRRSTGHPRNFAVEITLDLPDYQQATFGFEISAGPKGGFVVKRERLRIQHSDGSPQASYRVESGEAVEASVGNPPPPSPDRLYLVTASGFPVFRPVYDALFSMGFYNLNPEVIKEPQSPDAGELLHRDGGNIASVMDRLAAEDSVTPGRIRDYLGTIVPGIKDVGRVSLGPRETLEFRQEVVGAAHPWKFHAYSMSDGTLRALGALVAVSQLSSMKNRACLVGIEEPETALHPAATAALMDAIREASSQTQVVITSHSPDLIDQIDLSREQLLVVESHQGTTRIAKLDNASIRSIKDHLYAPGELLRMDQLEPDPSDIQRQEQLPLFTEEDEP